MLGKHLPPHRFTGEGANLLPGAWHLVTTIYFDTPARTHYRAAIGDIDHNVKIRAKEYYDLHPSLAELATDPGDIVRYQPWIWFEMKRRDGARTHQTPVPPPQARRPGLPGRRAGGARGAGAARDRRRPRGQRAGRHPRDRRLLPRAGRPLAASCLVNYRRLSWQEPDGDLRVTLDSELAFYAVPDDLWQRRRALVRDALGAPRGERAARDPRDQVPEHARPPGWRASWAGRTSRPCGSASSSRQPPWCTADGYRTPPLRRRLRLIAAWGLTRPAVRGVLRAARERRRRAAARRPRAAGDGSADARKLDIVDVSPPSASPGDAVTITFTGDRPTRRPSRSSPAKDEPRSWRAVPGAVVARLPTDLEIGRAKLRIAVEGERSKPYDLRVKPWSWRKPFRNLVGGFALLLFGIVVFARGVGGAAGFRSAHTLARLGRRPPAALGFGAGLGALVVSTTAAAGVLAGLVSSSLLALAPAAAAFLGALIGSAAAPLLTGLIDPREGLLAGGGRRVVAGPRVRSARGGVRAPGARRRA